jgi:O-antigen/teichoic acid export membrane protein
MLTAMWNTRQGLVVALGWLARIIGVAVSLALVRVALTLLGEGHFAAYQILNAALAWLSLSSLGLGPTLKNLVSAFSARGESDERLRETTGTILRMLFLLCVPLLVIFTPGVSALLLRKLDHDALWASRALLVGGILTLIAALGQVGMEVLYAELRAQWVYVLSMVGSVLTLLLMTRLGALHLPPTETLFWAVGATAGPPALCGVVALRMTRLLRLRFTAPDRATLRQVGRLALQFWVFAGLSNLILMVDYLVMSQILAAREIVMYSIMMRIATVGLAFLSTVIAVLWPDWARHWELRQWEVLRRRVRSVALVGVGVCAAGAAVAVVASRFVVRLWLGETSLLPPTMLVLEFVAYLAVRFWTDVHSAALMSGNRVSASTTFAVWQALITAPLEYVLGRMWGAEGVILGLLTGFLAAVS